jgi:hypothetical protein
VTTGGTARTLASVRICPRLTDNPALEACSGAEQVSLCSRFITYIPISSRPFFQSCARVREHDSVLVFAMWPEESGLSVRWLMTALSWKNPR